MEYPALGSVEAADSGVAQLYNSSEEREGRELDALRFDRERARRLWEAVSGAQPVGREAGESGGLRGRNPLARLFISSGVAEARGENADQPPGLRSHPLAPDLSPCATRPGTPLTRAPHLGPSAVGSSTENRDRGTPRIACK